MPQLKYCSIHWTGTGCITRFHDGVELSSYPHDTHHYHVISHRLGYGDDILAYCRQHDFYHHFCEEYFHDRPSTTLWAVAHGQAVGQYQATYEELVTQTCQRWVRASERPIIGDVYWDDFKQKALEALGQCDSYTIGNTSS
jgi:hypothetical protein